MPRTRGGGPPVDRPSAPRMKLPAPTATAPNSAATTHLARALSARTPVARAKHARAGLLAVGDIETQGLLLRQLYLGELEEGRHEQARTAAEQMIALGILGDVAHHDAARACAALGDFDAAVDHLHSAARVGPPERRTFHLSTLGGLLYAIGRAEEAILPLARALEEPQPRTVPLLRGQLALARFAAEGDVSEIDLAYRELLGDRSGEGYGRFVLGELAFARGDHLSARLHLEAFVSRVRRSRAAAQAALGPEVARASDTLARFAWN